MTTQRPPVSIASVLLQVFSGSADDPPRIYSASDLPALVALRSSGCITPKEGTIVAELSKLKKAGLVTWRAAEGRRPKDSRGARWMLTARGMERAAEEQRVFLGITVVSAVSGELAALPDLDSQHTPPVDRFDGEVWRGRVKVDDDWAYVAVKTANGSTSPVFFWHGKWRVVAEGFGNEVMSAWARASEAHGYMRGVAAGIKSTKCGEGRFASAEDPGAKPAFCRHTLVADTCQWCPLENELRKAAVLAMIDGRPFKAKTRDGVSVEAGPVGDGSFHVVVYGKATKPHHDLIYVAHLFAGVYSGRLVVDEWNSIVPAPTLSKEGKKVAGGLALSPETEALVAAGGFKRVGSK